MKLRALISIVMIHAMTLTACGVEEGETHEQEVRVDSTSRSKEPAKHGGPIGDPGPRRADPADSPRPYDSRDGDGGLSHSCKGRPKEGVDINPEICRKYRPANEPNSDEGNGGLIQPLD